MRDNEFTKILGWPGYRVYRHEINEAAKTLRLWVRCKRGNRKLICSGCGRKFSEAHDYNEREVRDLPWGEYRTTVVIEVYRVCCPQCGVKVEKVPQLPSKAPFSKRFEDAVGLACESASVRQVARQFRLAASTVRELALRYLQRWSATRRKDPLVQMGVDEIYFGKQMKFITVVSNLDTGEPLWFGQDRKQETLDEFFRKGGRMRGVVKGKRWLLLTRWMNLDSQKRQQLNELFALNRRVMKAYLLKESLERLWTYRYEGAMLRYLQSWIDQLRWQRLVPFQKLAFTLLNHLDGILNYCRTKVLFGVVEAINGNIKTLLRRGRGYKNLAYLLLKAQRMAVTKTEFIASESSLKCGSLRILVQSRIF